MLRRAALALAGVLAGALVASQWKDIARYVKMELMSSGGGHPGLVPASGSHHYTDSPAERPPAS